MEIFRFFDISFSEISLDMNEAYKLMGYGEHTPGHEVLNIINEIYNELKHCCRPYFGYGLFEGKIIDKEHIQLNNTILNPGRLISSAMKNAELFAAFTATAGNEFDNWLKQIENQDDIVKYFIANTLGSVIAESAVSLVMKNLEQFAFEKNMCISNNYSPGYCNWMLVEQKKLLALFPSGMTKIQLTDSCLMLPIKSISGIVGIGRKVKKRPYGCEICKMKNCIKNQKKYN
ncbi:MAG: 5-methyltetrahydrofolate--homocysteine methyltransferase [Prevotellaceae bacterium]|jgi:hypothetical protein|nr:5-methyltetrahydrofolate--homocysteine methyltransferase [Prevotellaceae bacterium]